MERRADERQGISISVEILDPPHLGKVNLVIRNISKSGAFILLQRENCPPVGRVVTLRMSGELWGEKLSTVSARVVRVTDEGMAVMFQDIDFK